MFVKIKNRKLIKILPSIISVRLEHPTISLPEVLTEEALASIEVSRVYEPGFIPEFHQGRGSPKFNPKTNRWEFQYQERVQTELEVARGEATGWAQVRAKRDQLLKATDFTQLVDAPGSKKTQLSWADYRQALRNITSDFATPKEVIWPTQPPAG